MHKQFLCDHKYQIICFSVTFSMLIMVCTTKTVIQLNLHLYKSFSCIYARVCMFCQKSQTTTLTCAGMQGIFFGSFFSSFRRNHLKVCRWRGQSEFGISKSLFFFSFFLLYFLFQVFLLSIASRAIKTTSSSAVHKIQTHAH